MLGVLVILVPPAQPVRRGELELFKQHIVCKVLVTDDIDTADLGHRAFLNIETNSDAVPLQRADDGFDGSRVFALGQVLALDFLLCPVQHGTVENQAVGQADLAQAFQHFVAGK